MPNVRLPEAEDTATSHRVAAQRPVDRPAGITPSSPGVLLPAGDILAPVPVPAPSRALALDALRLLRRLRDPARRPARWDEPAFGQEVDVVRSHLAPVRSRRSLAASFGREAFHVVGDRALIDDPGPVRLAYALRWLELGRPAVGLRSPCGTSARSPRPRPRRRR